MFLSTIAHFCHGKSNFKSLWHTQISPVVLGHIFRTKDSAVKQGFYFEFTSLTPFSLLSQNHLLLADRNKSPHSQYYHHDQYYSIELNDCLRVAFVR